jgi:hypothetical protein
MMRGSLVDVAVAMNDPTRLRHSAAKAVPAAKTAEIRR